MAWCHVTTWTKHFQIHLRLWRPYYGGYRYWHWGIYIHTVAYFQRCLIPILPFLSTTMRQKSWKILRLWICNLNHVILCNLRWPTWNGILWCNRLFDLRYDPSRCTGHGDVTNAAKRYASVNLLALTIQSANRWPEAGLSIFWASIKPTQGNHSEARVYPLNADTVRYTIRYWNAQNIQFDIK